MKRAKEQEFLRLKQGQMSVTEYAAKFNKLSCFVPNQVTTKEMKWITLNKALRDQSSG